MTVCAAFLGGTNFWIGTAVLAAIFSIFTMGLQLNVGFTGLLNFGQIGFAAIGAYTMAIIATETQMSLWLAMLLGIVGAVIGALLLGLTSLRLRGDYFAIASVAFAEVIRYTLINAQGLTGGNQGIFGYDGEWVSLSRSISDALGLDISLYEVPLLLIALAVVAIVFAMLRLLQSTPWGRVLRAIREDETAVRSLGFNPLPYKLQSLAIAAALGAISGIFLALYQSALSPALFLASMTFLGYTMMMAGGLGSYAGVILGAFLMEILLEAARSLPVSDADSGALRYVFVGVVLMVIVAVRPQGILGKREEMVLDD